MQLALIAAVCPETDLLILDEPTSGLDPIVRREFIEAIIGAYQEANPGKRTILVSTHLISEFEGLIDDFTILDAGRAVLTLGADEARTRYQKIRARFTQAPPEMDLTAALHVHRSGRELEMVVKMVAAPRDHGAPETARSGIHLNGSVDAGRNICSHAETIRGQRAFENCPAGKRSPHGVLDLDCGDLHCSAENGATVACSPHRFSCCCQCDRILDRYPVAGECCFW